jgi:transposase InsO family protein
MVREMCTALGLCRSGFYAWRSKPLAQRRREDLAVLAPRIRDIFAESRQTYGSARIGDTLREMGLATSVRRIRRIMGQHGLVPKRVRRFRCTTKRGPDTSGIPDLVERDFHADEPNRVWVGDITPIPTLEGILYLAFILDLFSRYLVGWATAKNKDVSLVIAALGAAVERRDPPRGFLFHSDHGGQYGADLFQSILRFHGGVPSMGSVGDAYDNAVCEAFVATLKGECINAETLVSHEFTNRLLFEFIEEFYNRKRKHSTLGNVSPYQFEMAHRV